MSDELLSQEELDALLQEHMGLDSESEQQEGKGSSELTGELNVEDFLSSDEQDTLAEIGNISMGSAATALSTLVDRKVRITVPAVYVSTPQVVTDSYPIPCVIVNVQYLAGIAGSNLLVIREQDALVIGNLMMGGDGIDVPGELDEIYLSAVTEAMNMMMGSAATAMSELFGRLIDISPPDTLRRDLSQDSLTEQISSEKPVVIVSFHLEIEGLVDSNILQIIEVDFAKEMARSLLASATGEMEGEIVEEVAVAVEKAPEMEDASLAHWEDLRQQPIESSPDPTVPEPFISPDLGNINIDLIRDIPVQVRAILGRTKMSIDNILRLGPGHIMELESLHGEPIEIFANDTLIARGEVVVVGEQFGVRITEIAAKKERIVSVG